MAFAADEATVALRTVLTALGMSALLLPGAAGGVVVTGQGQAPLARRQGNQPLLLAVKRSAAAEQLVARAGGDLVSSSLGVWRIAGPAASRIVHTLSARGLLRYAEPDRTRLVAGHLDHGDPLLAEAWQIARVGADAIEPPDGGVPLAIVDTGLDTSNPDFAGRPDITLLDAQHVGGFRTDSYHGTIVASTAAAAANGVGTVGIQPYVPLRIWDLKSLDDGAIIAALDVVSRSCPEVVNLSIGGPGYSRALNDAVLRLVARGCLVVAAAGNSYLDGNPTIYPARTPHVLTVAASDESDSPALFSSAGKWVDLAAPGVDIPVQSPDSPDDHALADGTSFAAPIVAAAASWVWTERPDLDASQIFDLLRSTARDIGPSGFDTRTGFGLVNIPGALAAPAPPPDPGEPNDDISLISAGGVFGAARPPLSGPITARLDSIEDPRDVYRIIVPAGATMRATVTPGGPLGLSIWNATTRSVQGPKSHRIALGSLRSDQSLVATWRNPSSRPSTAYVAVSIPGGRGGLETTYTLSVASS